MQFIGNVLEQETDKVFPDVASAGPQLYVRDAQTDDR